MAEAPPSNTIPILPLLVAAGIDTSRVRLGDNGPTMSIWFDGDADGTLARRALHVLHRGLRHASVYARGSTPERWHLDGNARGGDAIVVGELGYVLVKGERDRFGDVGTHGWDPAYPEMRGIFIASGPQVKRAGRIPAFENVHVFSFIAALLELERVPAGDGDPRVLAPYLRRARDD
jgi:hypothetical protein